jgi:iron(III) transport system permease protein
MKVWRLGLALGLIALGGGPLVLPFVEAFSRGSVPFADSEQLFSLAENTFFLVAGALALAMPLGVLLAVLLFRTDLPGRRFLLTGTIFALFIPLPLIVSAWQALIGSDGLFPFWFWGVNADRPWSAGLLPAIWVHALAGLPWVILIVGVGLGSVESELEEEALLAAGPWRVLWRVTLPRCRGAIAAAALWLGLQTASEITVTDVLLVPTFAEEIHTQFTMGGPDALARTLWIALPGVILTWVFLLVLVPSLERSLPPLQLGFTRRRYFSLGNLRWLWLLGCVLAGSAFVLVPLTGLVWKLGLAGSPRAWSAPHAARQFLGETRLYGLQVFETLVVALLTGALAAALALVASWAARQHRFLRILLLGLVALAWALPAPVVGIGLKETIMAIVVRFPVEPLPQLLYYGPSPVPIMWAHLLRFFPFAMAIMWPAVGLVPVELRDAARLEGAGPWQELWHVYWSMTRRALMLAVLTVTALSLGEVGACARVETPKWEAFAKLLFDRMHYGVDNNVAALALVLLAGIAIAFAIFASAARACVKQEARSQS